MKRRDFLRYSGLASTAFFVPQFLRNDGLFAGVASNTSHKLIVVQLSGGNDGLNTVIPYTNDIYFKQRPGIGIEKDKALRLTDDMGLNPGMQGLKEMFDNGEVCILNSVGYPNPNRSHFRSMDIWHTASDSDSYLSTGWVGRFLDSECNGTCTKPHRAIELDDTLSLSMKGEKLKALAVSDPKRLYENTNEEFIQSLSSSYKNEDEHDHELSRYLHKTLVETSSSASYVYEKSRIFKSNTLYPEHEFGKKMKTIAELIISGAETSVYYITLGGFDTHIGQKGKHERLLGIYSKALKAFRDDLKQNAMLDDALIMTFSEFGRRVKQNASAGTDHGAASNIVLAGGALKTQGFYNDLPDLADLDDGDIKYKLDFRSVYSSILDNWLKVDSKLIIPHQFDRMNFI